MGRVFVRAVLLLVLLTGCSAGDASPAASELGSASGAPSAQSTEPEPSQASASEGDGACTPPELCGGPLPPGDYRATTGTAEITFTVGDGWLGQQYGDLGFELVREGGGAPQVLSTGPYDGVVYSDVCSGAETKEIGPTAADFLAFLGERPGITARGDATEVTIGGRTGLQIDVDVADPGCVSDPPERLWLWEMAGVTDFHLNVGEAARLVALDGEDGVVVVIIETFDPTTFDALLDAAQPVLDSMAIS